MAPTTLALRAPTMQLRGSCGCGAACTHGKAARPAALPSRRRNLAVRAVKTTEAKTATTEAKPAATEAKPAAAPAAAKKSAMPPASYEAKYLQSRMETVKASFPTAFTADDFLLRLEMALCAFGFNGSNSIGIVNLCRDEATNPLRQKIEAIYPLVFNINGLGGGLTCGVTGMGAGLSHSPVSGGRKRYIFFSCPHIAIDSKGNVGPLARPGQQATNCACGAMIGALGQFNANGLATYATPDGEHEAADPEFSIFKQRLAKRIQTEKKELKDIDLVELTKICERQISSDLEFLISKAVDTSNADYAVITGVQVHNWGEKYDNGEPNLEIVAPTAGYVVINGVKTELDLASIPPLTPRQISMLTGQQGLDTTAGLSVYTGDATITDINGKGMFSAENSKQADAKKKREANFLEMLASSIGF